MDASEELKILFDRDIKDRWITIDGNGDGARGDKLERLLGKPIDNVSAPDYNGIELKTKDSKSSSLITLFTKVPNKGNELRERFGTVSQGVNGIEIKRLNATFGANNFTKTQLNEYNFRLRLDILQNKLFIEIADRSGYLVSQEEFFWELENLKEAVESKLKKIAVIGCETMLKDGVRFVKYTSIGFMNELSWTIFLELIRKGKIKVDIRMGQYGSGKYSGRLHDHGTGFRISFVDLINAVKHAV